MRIDQTPLGLCLLASIALTGEALAPSPANAQAGATAPARTELNRRLVLRVFNEMLNKRRFDLLDSLYAPGFVKHVNLRAYTLDEERVAARSMYEMSTDLVMHVEFTVAEDDRVTVAFVGRGTHDRPFGGQPASQRNIALSGATIFRVAGGKIAEEWTYYDAAELARQMAPAGR